jgi:hypothetical protein
MVNWALLANQMAIVFKAERCLFEALWLEIEDIMVLNVAELQEEQQEVASL